jgi:uncharacterized protein (TIGR03083 family)
MPDPRPARFGESRERGRRSTRLLLVGMRCQRPKPWNSGITSSPFAERVRSSAAAATDLTRPVPSCPEWTVADLVSYGRSARFLAADRLGAEPEDRVELERPSDGELLRWYSDGFEAVAELLSALDPAKPACTWSSQRNVGFIQRRLAQETAVHAWDALAAVGKEEPIERELAVDGIAEYLEFFLPAEPPKDLGSIHLHTTDGPGEWLIEPGAAGWTITREHAKGAAAARATASDLLFMLWRRRVTEVAQVSGEEETLNRFLASADLN